MYLISGFKKIIIVSLILIFILTAKDSFAVIEEIDTGFLDTFKGRVSEIVSESSHEIAETGTYQVIQQIKIEILNGDRKGEIVKFENDRIELEPGDKFYFDYYKYDDDSEYYAVLHRDRMVSVLVLIGVFIAVIIIFGGWQGLRSLVSLASSLFVVFYILIPGLLGGINPLLISFAIAAGILFIAIFLTHGFNRESVVAYVGTMISVLLTGVFAIFAVYITKLSGFEAEESIFLNFKTGGSLDFVGLLLGSIIIGVLGVLDDITITQAAFVTELYNSNKDLASKEVYKKAIRIGREHVGALVNTLALAYTCAVLPMIL